MWGQGSIHLLHLFLHEGRLEESQSLLQVTDNLSDLVHVYFALAIVRLLNCHLAFDLVQEARLIALEELVLELAEIRVLSCLVEAVQLRPRCVSCAGTNATWS
jgi:hypothetical protein